MKMLNSDAQESCPQGAPGVWTERGGEAPGASARHFRETETPRGLTGPRTQRTLGVGAVPPGPSSGLLPHFGGRWGGPVPPLSCCAGRADGTRGRGAAREAARGASTRAWTRTGWTAGQGWPCCWKDERQSDGRVSGGTGRLSWGAGSGGAGPGGGGAVSGGGALPGGGESVGCGLPGGQEAVWWGRGSGWGRGVCLVGPDCAGHLSHGRRRLFRRGHCPLPPGGGTCYYPWKQVD